MRPPHTLLCSWAPALATALVLVACRPSTQGAEGEPLTGLRQRESVRVVAAPVELREMVRRLETTTRIESRNQVQLFPRATGVVTELLTEEGQRVAVGQVLAQLDDREKRISENDARAALSEAQARVPLLKLAVREAEERAENAALSYEQAARDHDRNLAIAVTSEGSLALLSQRDLDASRLQRDQKESESQAAQLAVERAGIDVKNGEAAVARAELTLERAGIELSFMRITSPISGVIAERNIRVGDAVGSAAAVFVITDPDDLRTIFYRPQRELSLFQSEAVRGNGDDARADIDIEVRAEALPGRLFLGRIERISPTIDPASGNFRVTARLEPGAAGEPSAKLLPGMLVRLDIVTERHPDALVVPKRAVRREGDRSVVFALRAGLAHSVPVREGFSDDEFVELLPIEAGSLAVGEWVVVVGNRDLEDGARVTVRDAVEDAVLEAETADDAGSDG